MTSTARKKCEVVRFPRCLFFMDYFEDGDVDNVKTIRLEAWTALTAHKEAAQIAEKYGCGSYVVYNALNKTV